MAINVALGIREECQRGAPVIRVDCAGAVQHVRRDANGVARPEPDLDERRSALNRVPVSEENPSKFNQRSINPKKEEIYTPSAANAVERRSIAVGLSCLHATTSVVVCKSVAI